MDKSLDKNFKKLEEYLTSLEENEDNLDESIKIYEKANTLYKEMQENLRTTRQK